MEHEMHGEHHHMAQNIHAEHMKRESKLDHGHHAHMVVDFKKRFLDIAHYYHTNPCSFSNASCRGSNNRFCRCNI